MEIEEKLDIIFKLVKSVNLKLDKLVNQKIVSEAKVIVDGLKAEDGEQSVSEGSGASGIINKDASFTDSKPSEEVIMDLKEVTIIAQTEKAMLVTKKGLQKWIPISLLAGGDPELENGTYCEELFLREKKEGEKSAPEDWFPKKPWDKLVIKKGGKG